MKTPNKPQIPNSKTKPRRTHTLESCGLKFLWCLMFGVWCLLSLPHFAQATLFRLPLAANTSVHYYYDHGGVTDWKCGSETYSGHRGSDFSGGPRGKPIYAGAVGTVSYKIDGFGDGG